MQPATNGVQATPAKTEGRFWLVWSSQGRPPTYQHWDEGSAIREAERLARANSEQTFYVLVVVAGRRVTIPVHEIEFDEIPF